MGSVGLMFVGAALFLNALVALGLVDAKGSAPMNLFIGALQTVVPFYLVATANSPDDVLLASGIFLFGFTYLYVGIATLTGHSFSGFGWYSAWVAVMALGFGITEIVKFHDPTTGLLWLQWTVLWGLFFLVYGAGLESFGRLAAWTTLIMAFTTATVPGFVTLLGYWGQVPAWAVGIVIAVTAILLIPSARAAFRSSNDDSDSGAPIVHERVPVPAA